MKRVIKIVVTCLFLLYFGYEGFRAYERRNEGFQVGKICSSEKEGLQYEISVKEVDIQQVNAILQQPFYYLGHGFQCYAFLSGDGEYVLKFFRFQRMRLPEWSYSFSSFPFVKGYIAEKEEEFRVRKEDIFGGIKVGFEAAAEETGTLFVHLNKTKGLHPITTIYDKLGQSYKLSMDQMEFMVQKRASHIQPILRELMAQDRAEEAKKRLDQILELMVGCSKKGVKDTDNALIRKNNLGFLKDKAIYIDSGKFVFRDDIKTKEGFQKDLVRLQPLQRWLDQNYPELGIHFSKKKKQVIDDFS